MERNSSKKRFVTLILGVITLVIIVNYFFIYLCNYHTINSQSMVIKKRWRKLFSIAKPVDWIILGDSSCNCGVDEKQFSLSLNKSTSNFCTIGNSLILGDYLMLEYYIKNIGIPKNVLIMHVYDMWERGLDISAYSEIPFRYGYWNNLLPLNYSNLSSLFKLHLIKYFPIYSKNITLRRIFSDLTEHNKKHKNIIFNDGSTRGEVNPVEVLKDTQWHINARKRNKKFVISKINKKYLDKIIYLAEKYKFKVYLINSPVYLGLYNDNNFQDYFHQMEEELSFITDKHPNIRYISFNETKLLFAENQMYGADHVARTTVKELTEKIEQVIKRQKIDFK